MHNSEIMLLRSHTKGSHNPSQNIPPYFKIGLLVQVLAYETCDSTCTPPHTPKTSETSYITYVLFYKHIFHLCDVSHVSREFSNNIIKNLTKVTNVFNFIVYFT